ncbi:hypothetical protein Barb6_02765 [Bacteroidales bacterium Barb6]|nr:hypothetical protein Barb6_02765 [Bacteroidales bacterium Barb6]
MEPYEDFIKKVRCKFYLKHTDGRVMDIPNTSDISLTNMREIIANELKISSDHVCLGIRERKADTMEVPEVSGVEEDRLRCSLYELNNDSRLKKVISTLDGLVYTYGYVNLFFEFVYKQGKLCGSNSSWAFRTSGVLPRGEIFRHPHVHYEEFNERRLTFDELDYYRIITRCCITTEIDQVIGIIEKYKLFPPEKHIDKYKDDGLFFLIPALEKIDIYGYDATGLPQRNSDNTQSNTQGVVINRYDKNVDDNIDEITKIYKCCIDADYYTFKTVQSDDFTKYIKKADFKTLLNRDETKKAQLKHVIYLLSRKMGQSWYKDAIDSIGVKVKSNCSGANVTQEWKEWIYGCLGIEYKNRE